MADSRGKRYYAPEAGEWYLVNRKYHAGACCDWGLVHLVETRVRKGRIEQRAWRSEAQTAGKRSSLKKKREGVFKNWGGNG